MLYSITNAEFPHLFALREAMRHWRLLQLDPALLRRPVPATASDVLNADGSNLAAVLAQLKAETATTIRPNGVLSDIVAQLNNLIPGTTQLDAELHEASREYRIKLTMRDGLPFSSRVISDGTLRVLALLTLLHDPRHRGLICFEEPENGVHPARIKQLIQRLKDMVTSPRDFEWDEVHTRSLWFYDLRTNRHFTLKTRTLKRDDLRDFIACYHPENRHQRSETERFKRYSYAELMAREKASLDIFWLKDDSLDNLDELPPPDVLQQEIIDHLEAALAAFRDVAAGLPAGRR